MIPALALLLLLCYYPMLMLTGQVIAFGDDMAYGFFAPVVALYIVWEQRSALLRPATPSSPWSLAFIGFSACLGTVSVLANSSTFSRIAFLIAVTGCLLFVGGWPTLRRFLFPLSLLLFTFPIPDVFYGELTQPLQLLASRLAESAFELLGYSVVREGNVIRLVHMRLSVVEACSGLRSLVTLFFFCVVYSYYFESKLWLRISLVLLAIPSAIAVNALRITSTGVLGRYNMEWTAGTPHEILGWVAFLAGMLLVLALHQCARRSLTTQEASEG